MSNTCVWVPYNYLGPGIGLKQGRFRPVKWIAQNNNDILKNVVQLQILYT